MAGGYSDGSVIIDTKVSDSGAKAGFRELASMAENAARTVARVGREMAASTSGYVRAIRDARTGTASLTNDQRALEKAIRDTEEAISKRYEKLSLAEKRWEAAQQAAVEKAAAKFGEMNRGVELMPWESEEEAMEQFAHDQAQVIDEARKKFGEFEDSATFRNLATEITYLTEKLDGLRERLAEVQQQGAEGGMAPLGII